MSWNTVRASVERQQVTNVLLRAGKSWGFKQRKLLEAKAKLNSESQSAASIETNGEVDEDFYSQEKLDERFSLRHHPTVSAVLWQWWYTLRRFLAAAKRSTEKLYYAEYISLNLKVYKALIEEYEEEEALECVTEEWSSDSGGKGWMDRADVFDSLFELADLWTNTLEADDYADFLRNLLGQITGFGENFLGIDEIEEGTAVPEDYRADEEDGENGESSEEEDESPQASPKKKTITARIPSHSPQQRSRAAPTAPAHKPQQVNASHRVDTRGVHIKHSGQRRFNEVTEPVGTAHSKVPSEAAVSSRASCSSSRRSSVETKSSRRSSVEVKRQSSHQPASKTDSSYKDVTDRTKQATLQTLTSVCNTAAAQGQLPMYDWRRRQRAAVTVQTAYRRSRARSRYQLERTVSDMERQRRLAKRRVERGETGGGCFTRSLASSPSRFSKAPQAPVVHEGTKNAPAKESSKQASVNYVGPAAHVASAAIEFGGRPMMRGLPLLISQPTKLDGTASCVAPRAPHFALPPCSRPKMVLGPDWHLAESHRSEAPVSLAPAASAAESSRVSSGAEVLRRSKGAADSAVECAGEGAGKRGAHGFCRRVGQSDAGVGTGGLEPRRAQCRALASGSALTASHSLPRLRARNEAIAQSKLVSSLSASQLSSASHHRSTPNILADARVFPSQDRSETARMCLEAVWLTRAIEQSALSIAARRAHGPEAQHTLGSTLRSSPPGSLNASPSGRLKFSRLAS